MTDDTRLPEVGETVAITTVDSEPWLLVCAVDDDAREVTGVLVADLADETVQRLEESIGDRERRRKLTTAVSSADLMTFAVPREALRHLGSPGIQGCTHPQGGDV